VTPSRLSDCRLLYLYWRMKPRGEASDTLFAGGAQKRTFQMAVHFAGLCGGVWLGSDDDPQCRVVRELEKRNVKHLQIPFAYGRLRTARACARLLQFVGENHINVIHCNDRRTAMFGYLARHTAGVPYVYSARGIFHDKRHSRRFWGANIIAVSHAVRDNLTDFFGVPSHRITVIYNGTDIKSSNMEERAALRARLGIGPDTLTVSVIGRLSEEKGHSVLLEALAKVTPSYPTLRIICVGDGGLRDSLQHQAKQAGLQEHVNFCGFQDNVAAFIDISLFTIMPSLTEGMPGGVIESLVLGKPVVATSAGGTGEIVQDGVNGLLVPCGDSTRLAEAILTMLEDPERIRTMGENAKALSGPQLTLDSMLSSYEEYYHRLLLSPAPAEIP
jgi:glycosyltransferase involved in cell wall biosynthesis